MSGSDTIAAVATAFAAAGVGVIRVSGPAAPTIAKTMLAGQTPKPRHAHYAAFRDVDGLVLDRGLLLYFPKPNSFTGEHVLELHAHGSPVVLNMLLRRMNELGARTARPGEFSERAFHNGKLDLTQAEAIADLIACGSEAAARAAVRSLDGEFSAGIRGLLDGLVQLRVYIEAAIDFPEEEIDFLAAPQMAHDLANLQAQLSRLLAAAQRGVVLRNGLHVVIVGAPNAGKSSLLNALAQTDRAIVTAIPGTTRDALREELRLEGVALTLVDTAGLRETEDPIEREGMRRAQREIELADVVLLVEDVMQKEASRAAALVEVNASATRLIVHSKIDLYGELPRYEICDDERHFWVSAQTGAGLDLLRAELKRLAGMGESNEGTFTARSRHVRALEQVEVHLGNAGHALRDLKAGELAAEELRNAQARLGSITGEFSSDDLLGEIFSTFCVGK